MPDDAFLPDPSDPADVADLARALADVGRTVSRIPAEHWGDPTPCDDWALRQVVAHLAGMNLVFCALLAEDPPPPRTAIADAVLLTTYDDSSRRLVERFREPGVLERRFTSPMGTSTGSERLWIRMYDLLAHGWDVARATGQELDVPDALVERALAFAQVQVDTVPRDGRFAPARTAPATAPAIDRLAAFLGRDVSWRP